MSTTFEDLPVGLEFESARRTILDADVAAFAGLSGDFNPLHMDDLFARETIFGRRVAHGMLTASIVSGLRSLFDDIEQLAFLETSRRFLAPVFPGDTIRARFRVEAARLSAKRPGEGVVTFRVATLNQRDEVVQEGIDVVLVAARSPDRAA